MNQQLEEMAIRAGLAVAADVRSGYIYPDGFEEFAELIIKQCAYYADIFESLGCPIGKDAAEYTPSNYIKDQFGVK